MLRYIGKRLLALIPLLIIISVLSFLIIELPPGDYVTRYIADLEMKGMKVTEEDTLRLRAMYDLDKPVPVRYVNWITKIVTRGDFGRSFQYNRPVSELIWERLGLTLIISLITMVFTYVVAITIGIYSAVRPNTLFDYVFTLIGFIGVAVPGFLIAMIAMWLSYSKLGVSITGLFSAQYADAPWSLAKLENMLERVWVPVLVIGLSGTASIIRIMRSGVLDEVKKQYVVTARAKGVKEVRLLMKYPVRVAINPIISTIGWVLPSVISGESVVAIVLNLPTTGPLLLNALLNQDMYLAASFILLLSTLTVIGTVFSDILLAVLDPRIRYQGITK
ncbi:ABC transporter permease [Lachnotalea sp. AF33-28]|uniref:ABC transporter permease n=1 Tax=Lachnotalea sp. AF33-28 TaxID=2292046 RepID=UPI000E5069F7|nr:ABC transporter permease [Lachnotalea sp. AF33-28]RHP35553.1 ABC transporter permease [Lachnotalea sp. AF33-28]